MTDTLGPPTRRERTNSDLTDAFETPIQTHPSLSRLRSNSCHEISARKPTFNQHLKIRANKIATYATKKFKSEQFIRFRDKVMFGVGLVTIAVMFFELGKDACQFYRFYSFFYVVQLVVRTIDYRMKSLHYYLIEFCYYANVLFIIFLWFFPQSRRFYICSFAYAAGPLAMATIALSNSIVPHSFDKQAGVFIHVVPGLTMWYIRWTPCLEFTPDLTEDPTLFEFFGVSMYLYIIWAILYYVKVFIVSAYNWKQSNYEISYKVIAKNKGTLLHSIVFAFGEKVSTITYMCMHMTYIMLTVVLSYCCFYNYYLHTLVLILITASPLYLGGNYYVEYFSRRYGDQFEEGKKEE